MTCTPIPIYQNLCIPSDCKLVIFDLDDTLRDRKLYLGPKHKQQLSKHVIDILLFLRMYGVELAVASLHMEADRELKMYKVKDCFRYIEYRKDRYDWNKLNMLKKITTDMSIDPQHVILFDDNKLHCYEAAQLGIRSVLVNPNYGITWQDIRKGMNMFITGRNNSTILTKTPDWNTHAGIKLQRRHSCIIF